MTYDFLIIGGGVAGLSAAARLAPLGRTLVLEAEDALAYHTSGRSAALYEAKYGHDTTIALNIASYDHHATAHGGVLSPRGLIMLGSAAEDDLFSHDLVTMGLTEISPSEARDRVPIVNTAHVTRAAFSEAAQDIDTDKLVQDYARDLRAHGGTIVTGARVTGIARTDTAWDITCGDTQYSARLLCNAAGAWADHVAVMAGVTPLGLHPMRRSVARMPAPGGHDVTGWPMLFGAGETWYAKPDAGAWIVSPAEEDPMEPHDAWADDMVLAEGIARYQPFVTEEVTRVTSTWAGLRTFAPDRCLALGPDRDVPDFIWVAGQGGYGMQTSPAAGRLIADLVAGRRPELDPATVTALSPARFR